ncbi:hypothetical protein PanWU01x14_087100 [Parasponia andersonii]|uniref:Uncharacterized protein n=1 Tax=Parasponia andersonii TaxID=3476 RepID=A0A2P5D8F3_PARAD|nr:hypothetical protein PanWU01x14_087100 [Parasponia andersonii]
MGCAPGTVIGTGVLVGYVAGTVTGVVKGNGTGVVSNGLAGVMVTGFVEGTVTMVGVVGKIVSCVVVFGSSLVKSCLREKVWKTCSSALLSSLSSKSSALVSNSAYNPISLPEIRVLCCKDLVTLSLNSATSFGLRRTWLLMVKTMGTSLGRTEEVAELAIWIRDSTKPFPVLVISSSMVASTMMNDIFSLM